MTDPLILKIESCRDCPRFKTRPTEHFLIPKGTCEEYICTKANRFIMPHEGVKPPPKWCPIRE